MPPRASLYTLHIELVESKPLIWRRLLVPGHTRLVQFHHQLQAAMGWSDSHLHLFRIGDVCYGKLTPEDALSGDEFRDERKARLDRLVGSGDAFVYVYDLGDDWRHCIRVERVVSIEQEAPAHAWVEAGARACPPEDVGGVPAYNALLERLADHPDSEEVRDFFDWAGEDFDPERFDRHAANAALLRLAAHGWGSR